MPNQAPQIADKGDVNPRQGTTRACALLAAVAAAAILCIVSPAAWATEVALPTTQAKAYNADWVPYLDPPAKPAAVCLVDSGVDITPDTPADSETGPIVKRLSVDGGPGTAANTTWAGGHGTRMAFVGAAPINGWGAVGFWPGARIISIRAMPAGETSFPFDNYSRAIELCSKQARPYRIVAVNLALGCECQPTGDEIARLENQVLRAHSNGESVVAAAGNGGGPVGSPGRQDGILAVAAGGASANLCAFSNHGPEVAVTAPGCDVDLANPLTGELWSAYQSGTSGASVTVASALALLRSYGPEIDRERAEALLASTARATADGFALDVENLFRTAGLGALVDSARLRESSTAEAQTVSVDNAAPLDAASSVAPTGDARPSYEAGLITVGPRRHAELSAPRIAIRRARRRLTLTAANRPRRAEVEITIERRHGEFRFRTAATIRRSKDAVTFRLPRDWNGGRLSVRFVLLTGSRAASRAVLLRVR